MTKLNPNAAFPNPSRTFPTIGFSFLLDSSIPSSYFVQLHQFSALHERNPFLQNGNGSDNRFSSTQFSRGYIKQ